MEAAGRAGQEMSLAALRQHDPFITGIADVTGQVALYSFSPKDNEWVSPAGRARPCRRPGSRLALRVRTGPARGCARPGGSLGSGCVHPVCAGGEERMRGGEERKGRKWRRRERGGKGRDQTVYALGEAAQLPLGAGQCWGWRAFWLLVAVGFFSFFSRALLLLLLLPVAQSPNWGRRGFKR